MVMRRRYRSRVGESGIATFGSAGWLFADLMLSLVMAFLVANTVGKLPTPLQQPIVKPDPVLERSPVKIPLSVDVAGLQRNDPGATDAVKQQLLGNPKLANRRAGLVLAFGGASDDNRIRAIEAAGKVDDAISDLGRSGFVFADAIFREPFLDFGQPPNIVIVDVYLFKA